MNKGILRFFMLVVISLLTSVTTVMAQQTDDLQAFIDKMASSQPATRSITRADGPTIVDLSKFNATTRKTTLKITGGMYVRFINGILTRSSELAGPMVAISEESIVEVGDDAVFAGNCLDLGYELVNVVGGSTFIVDGSVMTLASTASQTYTPYKSDTGVVLDSDSHFKMTGGDALTVQCHGADAQITGGKGSINYASSLSVDGDSEIKAYSVESTLNIGGNAKVDAYCQTDLFITNVYVTSSLQGYINIYHYSGYYFSKDGDVIAEGYGGYNLTESDCQKVTYMYWNTENQRYTPKSTYLLDNKILIGEKPNTDIDNEDDLQKRLNEIAERGTATEEKPETIVIAEKGCAVTGVIVPKNCHAVITGGPLYIMKEGTHFSIILEGSTLVLKDITFDVSSASSSSSLSSYFWVGNYSKLTIGENVQFVGCRETSKVALCYLVGPEGDIINFKPTDGTNNAKAFSTINYYSGDFITGTNAIVGIGGEVYIHGGTIESSSSSAINGYINCYMTGGTLVGRGHYVIDAPYGFFEIIDGTVIGDDIFVRNARFHGGLFHGIFDIMNSTIKEGLWLSPSSYPDWHILPTFFLKTDCVMHVLNTFGSQTIKLQGKWSSFELGRSIILGDNYQLTQSDFSHIVFHDMPDNIEAYYDESSHTVKLRSKQPSNVANDEDDLQRLLDEIAERGTATEEKPDTIVIADKGIDVQYINVPANCHAVITGGAIRLLLTEHYTSFYLASAKSSLTFLNIVINVQSVRSNEWMSLFRVAGNTTVTIDKNVEFTGFGDGENHMRLCTFVGGITSVSPGRFNYYSGTFESSQSIIQVENKNTAFGIFIMYDGILRGSKTSQVPVIDCSAFYLYGGQIYGYSKNVISTQYFTMHGGMIYANQGSSYIEANLSAYLYGGTFTGQIARVKVGSGLQDDIITNRLQPYAYEGKELPIFYFIYGYGEFEINYMLTQKITFDAQWTEYERTIIRSYDSHYTLTEADFKLMEFLNLPDGIEAYYNEDDHTVRLRESVGNGTYTVNTDDDLQKMLDRIAARGKATSEKPDTIIITDKGINVRWVYTKENCHAVITGGPLFLQENAHCNFLVENIASLKFENITLNCSNKKSDHCFYVFKNATVTIGEDVTFENVNVNSNVTLCWFEGGGVFNYYSGKFATSKVAVSGSNGSFRMCGGTIESNSTVVELNSSNIQIEGGTICGHANMTISSVGGELYMRGGLLQATENGATFIKATWSELSGGKCEGKNCNNIIAGVMYIYPTHAGAVQYRFEQNDYKFLYICGELDNLLILNGDWSTFELQKPFIAGANGYTLTNEDFSNMAFTKMPDAIRASYDWESHSVILLKALTGDEDDLQDFLDNLEGQGTEESPTVIPICYCGVRIPKRVALITKTHAIIDGKNEEGKSTDFTFDGGTFTVSEEASLRLKNLDFYGTGTSDSNFRIAGTLFVDENVTLTRFSQFIKIEKGGKVVWNNETAVDASSEVIYNDGGTIEILRGTFVGGIRNGGSKSFGGDDFVGVINHEKGGVIYITKAIESISREVNISINIDAKSIEIDKPIITGATGYTLTESDMKYITINLPEGYEWKLVDGSVVITTSTGVDYVSTGACIVDGYYDTMGNHIASPRKGVNIVRYSNGKTKKIVVK